MEIFLEPRAQFLVALSIHARKGTVHHDFLAGINPQGAVKHHRQGQADNSCNNPTGYRFPNSPSTAFALGK